MLKKTTQLLSTAPRVLRTVSRTSRGHTIQHTPTLLSNPFSRVQYTMSKRNSSINKNSTRKNNRKNSSNNDINEMNGDFGLSKLFGEMNLKNVSGIADDHPKKLCKTKKTVEEVKKSYESVIGKEHLCVKTKNKGGPGHLLEDLLGISHSSDCLDLVDGEIKGFPLKSQTKSKESVAVTMVEKDMRKIPFEESRVYKKLKNTLFIPYERKGKDNEYVCFSTLIHFTESHPLFEQIKKDYEDIQSKSFSSNVGVYLQTRTKGAGHGSTSRAFYLRATFMNLLLKKD